MKRAVSLLWAVIWIAPVGLFAQLIQSPTQADNPLPVSLSMPAANTSIDFSEYTSSQFDLVMVAYDDFQSHKYEVQWIAPNGASFSHISRPGVDPDAQFFANADVAFVAYQDLNAGSIIKIDQYALQTSPLQYNLDKTFTVGPGRYPNLDINKDGNGVITWEEAGEIWVASFYTPVLGPPVSIGPGIHPDVILADDGQTVVLTYVDGGELFIIQMDYTSLTMGTYSMIHMDVESPWVYFMYPRIAASRQGTYLTPLDFTVVAEDVFNPTETRLVAYTYQGGALAGDYEVSAGMTACLHQRPVVAYQEDEILFAWSADYNGCSFSLMPPNGHFQDVLFAQYDANTLTNTLGGDLIEINQAQGPFFHRNVSIASRPDGFGAYTTPEDGIVYSDAAELYWKRRTSGGAYRKAAEAMPRVQILGNPISESLLLSYPEEEEPEILLLNLMGQEINLAGMLSHRDGLARVHTVDLAAGIYTVVCRFADGETETHQVIRR
ncbi:hypothetical protein [Pontibacter sp. G13]|uniref:hypothetical protein n=1 Tax=Pontibacter sp. G13 TaxID=3074898 RepID=UPI0028898C7A|nr:hypothetical protein [Pontibacter sp. G13]WNJ17631.1 hypothetical protein RJD25_22500 [Pontibacter sp. G13]